MTPANIDLALNGTDTDTVASEVFLIMDALFLVMNKMEFVDSIVICIRSLIKTGIKEIFRSMNDIIDNLKNKILAGLMFIPCPYG